MHKLGYTAILILIAWGFATEDSKAQEVPVYEGFESFKPLLQRDNDSTYVINFWATWCSPCVKEMPYFQKAHEKYSDDKLHVVLVSLDFGRRAEERVKKFLQDKNLTPRVVILDDPQSNSWINQVDSGWSGAIPATVIYNASERSFYEKQFTKEELFSAIEQKLQ